MEIVNRFFIKSQGDLLFSKLEVKNVLAKKNKFVEDYVFALMELGTNILKYPKEGEIWLLKEEDEFLLAALDRGKGIEDIKWALKEGNSSSKTLGVGLASLNKLGNFKLSIFSKKNKGTVVLFKPKSLEKEVSFLIRSYMDMKYCGDFILKKGKFYILADVSGHGLKAKKTADKVIEFFKSQPLSCVILDDIFKKLHEFINQNDLRSVVLSIVEKSRKFLSICGVGNIKIMLKLTKELKILTQKSGVIGECYTNFSKYTFSDYDVVAVFSDGIEEEVVRDVFLNCDDIHMCAIACVYFSDVLDDKSILIIRRNNERA